MKRLLVGCLLIAVFPVVITGCGYNQLQQLEENVFRAWSDVESTLQRRADLIPNLVETVKGYATHEKETFEAVTMARSQATSLQLSAKDLSDPAALQRLQEAQATLSSALSRLLVVVERYPDLKAYQSFQDFRPNWKEPKIGSMSPASVTIKPLKNSTLPSAHFPIA